MTSTEQVKILDDKIKANKAQYDLDRGAAKISSLSSGELEKHEYLTGEDLGYKVYLIQEAKFEYSPLGKVINKGLDKINKKEGVSNILKNIDSKNEQQLQAIKNQEKKQSAMREKCPNTEFLLVQIQTEYRKIWTRKNSIFGHVLRSAENN